MRLARWLVVLVVMLAAPRFAVAQQPAPILPLNQVRPGLKGYGLSVFRGTRIEKFDVTIIDVLRGIDFEMDMVLIRLDSGPAVDERWGIIEGMSGSPIYTQDGRLIGALAYGWEFQIEPIAGVTPIEQMIEQFDPRHPIAQAYAERRDTEQRRDPRRQETAQTGALWPRHGPLEVAGRPVRSVELARNDDDARLMARRQAGAGVLKPLATPVMVSGMGMRGMRLLEDLLAPHNLRPVQAGGVRADTDTAYEFKPGAAVSVPLITGDISLEGVGTVTYVDDDMVLAFGHPMMSLGAVDMPMDVAYIHQIIGGQVSSFKLGGGIATVGRLTQDRPTCVGGRLGERADILPATFSLTQPDRGVERRFDLFVSRFPMANRYLAGMLATAIENVAGSDFDGVIHADLALLAREVGEGTDASAGEGDETAEPTEPGEPLRIVRSNSFDTKAGSAFGVNPTADLLTTLLLLETNPFGEAEVERLAVDVRFVQDRSFATIERAAADQQIVKRGETIDITLDLKPYGGDTESLDIPLTIPDNAPLGRMLLAVIGGADGQILRPRLNPPPEPTDVPSLVTFLNNTVPNDVVVIEMLMPTMGLEIAGHQLRDLPPAVSNALLLGDTAGVTPIRDVVERIVDTDRVLSGIAALSIEVVGDEGERSTETPEYPSLDSPRGMGMPGMSVSMQSMLAARAAAVRQLAAMGRALPSLLNPAELAAPMPDPAARLDQALLRLQAQAPATPPAAAPARPWYARLWPWSQRAAEPTAPTAPAAPAAPAEAPAAEPAEDAGPPDVTDALNLDEPAAMPTWEQVDRVGSGELPTGGGAAASGGGEAPTDGEALARPTSRWSVATAEEFAKGRFEGTYPTNDGRVGLAPTDTVLAEPDAKRLWGLAAGADGSVYVGSWDEKPAIYQIAADGSVRTLLERDDDVGLPALAVQPNGDLLVGAVPSGRIFRVSGGLESPAQAMVLADLDVPYIWALVPDGRGGVYAATGNHGRLYQIDADGAVETLFTAGDRHVTALTLAPDNVLYAGTSPTGKVYRVLADGTATTVFQTPQGQGGVQSLAATADGSLFVGTSGGKVHEVQPDGVSRQRLDSDGGPIYSLVAVGNQAYATAGGPGQVFRFGPGDQQAQIFRTDEPVLIGLAAAADGTLFTTVATSGEIHKLALNGTDTGAYLSGIHDAGTRAQWGAVRWRTDGELPLNVETRSGNTSIPDTAWSDWTPVAVAGGGYQVASPPGRYLQFRTRLYGNGTDAALQRVEVMYRTVNRAPTVELKEPAAAAVVRGEVKVDWEGKDPDDDTLRYRVEVAPAGTDDWQPVRPKSEAASSADGAGGKPDGETEQAPGSGDEAAPAPPSDAEVPDAPPADVPPPDTDPDVPPGTPGAVPLLTLAAQPGDAGAQTPDAPPAEAPAEAPAEVPASGDAPNGTAPAVPAEPPKPITESQLTWDTTQVPDGAYVLRVVASDAQRNPDLPREAVAVSAVFIVDNTQPYPLEAPTLDAAPPAELVISDATSYLASAEVRVDGGEWAAVLPVDGLFDSSVETLRLPTLTDDGTPRTLDLRVRDAAGNVLKLTWSLNKPADDTPTESPAEPPAEQPTAPAEG